jgi:hypothetical protein
MGGVVASVVVIAVFLGVLLVAAFDVFCLLHLWAAATAHLVPKFVWAILIVCTSPIGGLVYLLAQRLPKRMTMRTRPWLGGKAWFGPAAGGDSRFPASPEGHAVGVVAIAATAYLVLTGQVLAVAVVVVAFVTIVFLKATSPDSGTVALYARDEFQARRDHRPGTPGH